MILDHFPSGEPPQISLAVLDLSAPGGISLLNTGTVDLLVSDVQLYCRTEITHGYQQSIQKIIKRGEVLTVPLNNDAYGDAVLAGKEFDKYAHHFGNNHSVRYYSAGHSSMSFFRNVKGFKSVEATGVVFYVPTSKTVQKRLWVEVPLEGFMVRKGTTPKSRGNRRAAPE